MHPATIIGQVIAYRQEDDESVWVIKSPGWRADRDDILLIYNRVANEFYVESLIGRPTKDITVEVVQEFPAPMLSKETQND